jgi:hypothetical protein
MSEWFCRTNNGQVGPVSFQEMAKLLNAAELLDSDQVRRSTDDEWQPAEAVVGLCREARRLANLEASAVDSHAAESREAVSETVECEDAAVSIEAVHEAIGQVLNTAAVGQTRAGVRRWRAVGIWLLGLAAVTTSCVAGAWWFQGPERFPAPKRNRALRPTLGLIEQIRLPAPEKPSVPGLQPKTPQLIPGCEQLEPIYSPTLSEDLHVLVFAQMNGGHLYDLFVATRADLASPFGVPQLVESTQTNETEAYSSLSPDGLELFYVSSDSSPIIWSCSRKDGDSAFGVPVEWAPSDWKADQWRVGYPQFVSQTELVFGAIPLGADSRTIFRAVRADSNDVFDGQQTVAFADGRPPYFVSRDRLRGYFGTPAGLYIAVRQTIDEAFREPVILVPARICGAMDGPLWLAPAEDVVFYCGPGAGQPVGSARRMWQLRL